MVSCKFMLVKIQYMSKNMSNIRIGMTARYPLCRASNLSTDFNRYAAKLPAIL